MYSLYKDILPPSSVDQCLHARFTAPTHENLLVSRGSTLEIYRVVYETVDEIAASSLANQLEEDQEDYAYNDDADALEGFRLQGPSLSTQGAHKAKTRKQCRVKRLEFMHRTKLNGVIISMEKVRLSVGVESPKMDCVLLAFKDAKVSIVEWSAIRYDIETVSLHYFERDEFKKEASCSVWWDPFLRVDPENRCAILSFYHDKIAVIPFKSDIAAFDDDTRHPYQPSFVLPLNAMDPTIRHIHDLAFLNNYLEPTLAILYSSSLSWTGRLASKKDTCSIIVVSLGLRKDQSTYPILYRVDGLPYNCERLIPAPSKTGGVVVLSTNGIIHIDQLSVPGVAAAVNGYWLKESPENPLLKQTNLEHQAMGITLDGTIGLFTNPDTLLLSQRTGEIVIVEFIGSDGAGRGWERRHTGVKKIVITRTGVRANLPSCVTEVGRDYLFLGSRVADGLLIEIVHETTKNKEKSEGKIAEKKGKSGGVDSMETDHELDDTLYDSNAEIARATTKLQDPKSQTPNMKFRVTDSILVTGPLRDITYGQSSIQSEECPFTPDIKCPDLELVAATGEGVDGSLCVLHRSVRPVIESSFDMEGVVASWTLRVGNLTDEYHRYLVLSYKTSTLVLETGEDLTQLDGSDFVLSSPTIECATVGDGQFVLQVTTTGCYALNSSGRAVCKFTPGQTICQASICDPYVAFICSNGEFHILKFNTSPNSFEVIHQSRQESLVDFAVYQDNSVINTVPTVGDVKQQMGITAAKQGKEIKAAVQNSNMDIDYGTDNHGATIPVNGTTSEAFVGEDEDAFLYGDTTFSELPHTGRFTENMVVTEENVSKLGGLDGTAQAAGAGQFISEDEALENCTKKWLFTGVREDGVLEIQSLPDMKTVFVGKGFGNLEAVIEDEVPSDDMIVTSSVMEASNDNDNIDQEAGTAHRLIEYSNQIRELVMVALGRSRGQKTLYIVVKDAEGEISLYKASPWIGSADEQNASDLNERSDNDRLAVRFVKVSHEFIANQQYQEHELDELEGLEEVVADTMDLQDADNEDGETHVTRRTVKRRSIKPFSYIGGPLSFASSSHDPRRYEGLFISGKRPCFITCGSRPVDLSTNTTVASGVVQQLQILSEGAHQFLAVPVSVASSHGQIRLHPFTTDGAVSSFTEFHNVNCRFGFIYFTKKGQMRVARLPEHINYDHDWGVLKRPLLRTVHHITYHHSSHTYILVSSQPHEYKLPRAQHAAAITAGTLDDPNQPYPDTSQRDQEAIEKGLCYPLTRKFYIELITPATWETVDVQEMDEFEYVLSIECISLNTKSTLSGRKQYVIVGCGHARGEDLANRGRIRVLDVVEIVPDPSTPHIKHRLKEIYKEDVRGPVSALGGCEGYLVGAIGQKVIVYEWEDTDSLFGVAFLDVQSYVVSLSCVKGMILVGDIHKSVMFIGFQEDPAKLVLLGKDFHRLQVYANEIMVEENQLAFVVADIDKNIHLYTYNPFHVQSQNGQKLIRRGDFHVGANISKIIRLRKLVFSSSELAGLNVTDGTINTQPKSLNSRSLFNLCSTLDGGIAVLVPLSEKVYRRLWALSIRLVNELRHQAGLNPRSYRLLHCRENFLVNPAKNVLDGELLYRFTQLSSNQRDELALVIGSDTDKIMKDLSDAIGATEYF